MPNDGNPFPPLTSAQKKWLAAHHLRSNPTLLDWRIASASNIDIAAAITACGGRWAIIDLLMTGFVETHGDEDTASRLVILLDKLDVKINAPSAPPPSTLALHAFEWTQLADTLCEQGMRKPTIARLAESLVEEFGPDRATGMALDATVGAGLNLARPCRELKLAGASPVELAKSAINSGAGLPVIRQLTRRLLNQSPGPSETATAVIDAIKDGGVVVGTLLKDATTVDIVERSRGPGVDRWTMIRNMLADLTQGVGRSIVRQNVHSMLVDLNLAPVKEPGLLIKDANYHDLGGQAQRLGDRIPLVELLLAGLIGNLGRKATGESLATVLARLKLTLPTSATTALPHHATRSGVKAWADARNDRYGVVRGTLASLVGCYPAEEVAINVVAAAKEVSIELHTHAKGKLLSLATTADLVERATTSHVNYTLIRELVRNRLKVFTHAEVTRALLGTLKEVGVDLIVPAKGKLLSDTTNAGLAERGAQLNRRYDLIKRLTVDLMSVFGEQNTLANIRLELANAGIDLDKGTDHAKKLEAIRQLLDDNG
jgi:hypothetical protein